MSRQLEITESEDRIMRKEMTLAERKEVSIKILEKIDAVCQSNKLTYWLAYGTLIGAMRHSGIIPWDDDIDIWVPINEYERFIRLMEAEKDIDVISGIESNNWPFLFTKISQHGTIVVDIKSDKREPERGVAVDVFPLCFCSGSNDIALRILRNLSGLATWLYFYDLKQPKWFAEIIRFLRIDASKIKEKCLVLAKKHSKSLYYCSVASPYGKKDIHRAEWFADTKYVLFEGKKYPVPLGYDFVLTTLYGDWRLLPPPEQQVSNHNVIVYREINNNYKKEGNV